MAVSIAQWIDQSSSSPEVVPKDVSTTSARIVRIEMWIVIMRLSSVHVPWHCFRMHIPHVRPQIVPPDCFSDRSSRRLHDESQGVEGIGEQWVWIAVRIHCGWVEWQAKGICKRLVLVLSLRLVVWMRVLWRREERHCLDRRMESVVRCRTTALASTLDGLEQALFRVQNSRWRLQSSHSVTRIVQRECIKVFVRWYSNPKR